MMQPLFAREPTIWRAPVAGTHARHWRREAAVQVVETAEERRAMIRARRAFASVSRLESAVARDPQSADLQINLAGIRRNWLDKRKISYFFCLKLKQLKRRILQR